MGKLPYTGTIKLSSVIANDNKPLDVRTVVSYVEDLTNNTIPNLYTGIVVNVKGTGDLYVLTSSPRTAHLSTSWKKIGVDVDLSDYVKFDDLPDYLTDSDLDDYAKKSDIPDVSNFAEKNEIPSVEGLASKDWVEGKGYLTSHQSLDDYALKSDIPDVSGYAAKSEIPSVAGLASEQWVQNQGYLTSHQSLDAYALKSELPSVAGLASEQWVENKGYLTVNDLPDYLSDSDLDDYALKSEIPSAGSFPADSDIEDLSAPIDGMATVQDVMDYVQAYFEKKKDELDNGDSDVPLQPYAYMTGYGLNDTPTDITQFNEFVLNESGDTEIEFYTPQEFAAWDPSTNDDLPSVKLTVDIPDGYSIKNVYMWNVLTNNYDLLTGSNEFIQNPRYTSRIINGVTYNSYVRGDSDPTATRGLTRYKIIITI